MERGIITSGDTLAQVLPRISAGLGGADIEDAALRRLYAAIYRAFRRRRSLLLLNLESQVRLDELPWIAAMRPFRNSKPETRDAARRALEEAATLALTAFPHAIVPDKLLRELQSLAGAAKLELPLVEEVAADIFMGRFSEKFVKAALLAADLLAGSIYERYYGINFPDLKKMARDNAARPPPLDITRLKDFFTGGKSRPAQKTNPDWFAKLCEARAGTSYGDWRTATNGMLIERKISPRCAAFCARRRPPPWCRNQGNSRAGVSCGFAAAGR